jgi:hypothetical protein
MIIVTRTRMKHYGVNRIKNEKPLESIYHPEGEEGYEVQPPRAGAHPLEGDNKIEVLKLLVDRSREEVVVVDSAREPIVQREVVERVEIVKDEEIQRCGFI